MSLLVLLAGKSATLVSPAASASVTASATLGLSVAAGAKAVAHSPQPPFTAPGIFTSPYRATRPASETPPTITQVRDPLVIPAPAVTASVATPLVKATVLPGAAGVTVSSSSQPVLALAAPVVSCSVVVPTALLRLTMVVGPARVTAPSFRLLSPTGQPDNPYASVTLRALTV